MCVFSPFFFLLSEENYSSFNRLFQWLPVSKICFKDGVRVWLDRTLETFVLSKNKLLEVYELRRNRCLIVILNSVLREELLKAECWYFELWCELNIRKGRLLHDQRVVLRKQEGSASLAKYPNARLLWYGICGVCLFFMGQGGHDVGGGG